MSRRVQCKSSIEIVLNRCWGGFGLSRKGMARLLELGFPLTEGDTKWYPQAVAEEGYFCYDPTGLERHDPRLVQVVRELGAEANGSSAKLEIVTVYSGYEFKDHDGRESLI